MNDAEATLPGCAFQMLAWAATGKARLPIVDGLEERRYIAKSVQIGVQIDRTQHK